MNRQLTWADTEPERALKITAAVGMMRWSFIFDVYFITDENYEMKRSQKSTNQARRRHETSVGTIDSTVGSVKTQLKPFSSW